MRCFCARVERRYPWLPAPLRRRYAHAYGTRLERVLGAPLRPRDLGEELLPQLYERELEYLCREEFARSAEDILWRRSKLGLHLLSVDSSPLERWLAARCAGGTLRVAAADTGPVTASRFSDQDAGPRAGTARRAVLAWRRSLPPRAHADTRLSACRDHRGNRDAVGVVPAAALGAAARGGGGPRRRAPRGARRLQFIILLVVVGAAGVCGFALSQWLTSGERAAQSVMQRELQARVAEISRTASQLELTRGSERAEIESGVLRRIGSDGVVVTATVAACRPPLLPGTPGATRRREPPPRRHRARRRVHRSRSEPGDAVRDHPRQCQRDRGGALQPRRRLRGRLEREPLSAGAGVRAGTVRGKLLRERPRGGRARGLPGLRTGRPITRAAWMVVRYALPADLNPSQESRLRAE